MRARTRNVIIPPTPPPHLEVSMPTQECFRVTGTVRLQCPHKPPMHMQQKSMEKREKNVTWQWHVLRAEKRVYRSMGPETNFSLNKLPNHLKQSSFYHTQGLHRLGCCRLSPFPGDGDNSTIDPGQAGVKRRLGGHDAMASCGRVNFCLLYFWGRGKREDYGRLGLIFILGLY